MKITMKIVISYINRFEQHKAIKNVRESFICKELREDESLKSEPNEQGDHFANTYQFTIEIENVADDLKSQFLTSLQQCLNEHPELKSNEELGRTLRRVANHDVFKETIQLLAIQISNNIKEKQAAKLSLKCGVFQLAESQAGPVNKKRKSVGDQTEFDQSHKEYEKVGIKRTHT